MSDTGPGLRAGARFGPYRLERLLSRSAVAEVYEAEDTRNEQVVALKLFSAELCADRVLRGRLEQEAESAGQVTDAHVLPIQAYGEIDGRLYVEMALIDGTDLATLLAEAGPLSPPRAVAVIRQVAEALDAAHDTELVHRDVEPHNILLTDDDIAYLMNFGFGAVLAERAEEVAAEDEDGDDADDIADAPTRSYLAPEQLTDAAVGRRADVYALTEVLAETLTGVPVFTATGHDEALDERLTTAPPRPSRLRPGRVPAAMDAVVARGLSRKPADRYGSAGELAQAAFDALTEPEQHQVARILRRGGSSAPAPRQAAEITVPTRPHLVLSDLPSPGWAPPEDNVTQADFGSAGPLPITTLRNPDFADQPLRLPPAPRVRFRRKPVLVVAAVLTAVAATVGVRQVVTTASAASTVAAPPQQVLAFDGLDYHLAPGGLAVDGDGNTYVTSLGMHGKVVKLPAGSHAPVVLPFSEQYQPRGVVVDNHGNVYFSDANNRVVRVAADSSAATVLPFSGLERPDGVAVDGSGNVVYVADRGNNQVVKLDTTTNTQTTVPFVGLNNPDGVAVDAGGAVYVTDTDNNRVLKLAAGAGEQTVLPFAGIVAPWGITVAEDGTVYVSEHNRNKVVKLPAGGAIPVVLPFTGLNSPMDVAVDRHGAVYVADRGNDRVLKVVSG